MAWVGYQAPGRRVVRRLMMNTRQVGRLLLQTAMIRKLYVIAQAILSACGQTAPEPRSLL
jgi:hypothetical protein